MEKVLGQHGYSFFERQRVITAARNTIKWIERRRKELQQEYLDKVKEERRQYIKQHPWTAKLFSIKEFKNNQEVLNNLGVLGLDDYDLCQITYIGIYETAEEVLKFAEQSGEDKIWLSSRAACAIF